MNLARVSASRETKHTRRAFDCKTASKEKAILMVRGSNHGRASGAVCVGMAAAGCEVNEASEEDELRGERGQVRERRKVRGRELERSGDIREESEVDKR